jgi:GAF domain-containing protein
MVSKQALERALVAAVEVVDARAGSISQMLGDVLLQVAEHVPGGGTLRTGHGYLVSDYPVTQEVLTESAPRAVSVHDRSSDAAEVALLQQLGYDALLMLPLVVDERVWGLVELYDVGRAFDDADARVVETALADALRE